MQATAAGPDQWLPSLCSPFSLITMQLSTSLDRNALEIFVRLVVCCLCLRPSRLAWHQALGLMSVSH